MLEDSDHLSALSLGSALIRGKHPQGNEVLSVQLHGLPSFTLTHSLGEEGRVGGERVEQEATPLPPHPAPQGGVGVCWALRQDPAVSL